MKEEDGHAHADDDRSQGAERAKGHDASAEPHGMSEARHQEQPAKPLHVGRGAREQLKERESDENEPGVLRQVAVASNGSVEGAIRISIAQVGFRSAPLPTHEDHQDDVQKHDGAGGGGALRS